MTPRRRARAARRWQGDDRGSLALAMLVAIVGAGLAALLLPMVVVQIHTTTFGDSRAREINAAEAGAAVALGTVRAATNSTGAGVVTKLPCTTGSPITGSVAASTGGAAGLSYRVTIGYYVDNPLGQPDSWLAPYSGMGSAGHGMLCSAGSGTYYPPTKDDVPRYVLITATGSDSRGSRTLRGTYYVKTSNANVAGGTIYIYPSGSSYYCLDAGSAQPIAGTAVTVQPCATTPNTQQPGVHQPVTPQQAWSYDADLSIQLVSSVTSTYPNGLCLSALDDNGSTQSAGDAITLQPCAKVGSAPWNQMWSVNDSSHLQNTKTDESGKGSLCIQVDSQRAGRKPYLAGCTGDTYSTTQTWIPSPDAGPGAAGAADHEIVNFAQFGRCIDVTNQSVKGSLDGTPGGNNFLIAYSCKQDPSAANLTWNQLFTPRGAQWVTDVPSDKGGGTWCLYSPEKAYNKAKAGPWVTVSRCASGDTGAVSWTRYGATDAQGNLLPVDQRYTIQDDTGLCLSLNDSNSADYYMGQYAKVVVEACDGSTVQKWNAQPDVAVPMLKDLYEITVPTG